MKIAVWKTGHEIADTVADALAEGFNASVYDTACPGQEEYNIGYGILRNMDQVFRHSKHWFNVDRGYFGPGHFDGYYRISYKGTQAKYDPEFPITKEFVGELAPIRAYDKLKPILVCPPTDAVRKFFNIADDALSLITTKCPSGCDVIVREKGAVYPINWDDCSAVVTFNSSVGWEALRRGIPCLSDPLHSVVGSYYNTKSIDEAIDLMHIKPRKPLFDFMSSHQFTLAEISMGLAWPLIQNYTCSSVGTEERRLHQMSQPILSAGALKHHFQ